MIIRVSQSGKIEYGIVEFCLDTPSDLESLKSVVGCEAGSVATIISTGQVYIKNSAGQWILQPARGSGGGSSPSTEGDIVVINETTPAPNNDNDIIVL